MDGFIKAESYSVPKEARGINSRCDAFKVYSGRWFKAIEDQLYKNEWFIKHIPVPERPALIAGLYKAGLRYYENDYKAFESHFTAELLRDCECQLYNKAFSSCPEVADFICKVISGTNRIHMRGGLVFELSARRMSGDMCTSLGNGFTNLMVILFLVHEKHGIVNGFVEGDDGLFATDVELTSGDFSSLGFTVDIHELRHPCLGHFCGNTCSTKGEVMKDPRDVFRTFFWTASCIHAGDAVLSRLLRAKALSLAYELPQCPILGALARAACAKTDGITPRWDGHNAYKPVPVDYEGPTGAFSPSPEARDIFCELYGISVEAQKQTEQAFLTWDLHQVTEIIPPLSTDLWYTTQYLEYG